MTTPYKMKGSPMYRNYGIGSPAKELTDEEKKKKRIVELSKENEGKPGFNEYRNKVFKGKTTVKDGVSTTKTDIKKD